MTTHIREDAFQVVATEDLMPAKFKVITFAGTIAQAADRLARAAGICRFTVTSGGHTGAIYSGITKAFIGGGTVSTPGWPLMIANSGYLIAATSGQPSCARLCQTGAAASGDLAAVMAGFTNVSPAIVA